MAKVVIYLREHELTALHTLAEKEYRALKAQAALIIRNELMRLGMIEVDQQSQTSSPLSKGSVIGG